MPLKAYLLDPTRSELRWLHARLAALMPSRQAMRVMELLLRTVGRDSHVAVRNHTVAVGAAIQRAAPSKPVTGEVELVGELGIDVSYVRKIR